MMDSQRLKDTEETKSEKSESVKTKPGKSKPRLGSPPPTRSSIFKSRLSSASTYLVAGSLVLVSAPLIAACVTAYYTYRTARRIRCPYEPHRGRSTHTCVKSKPRCPFCRVPISDLDSRAIKREIKIIKEEGGGLLGWGGEKAERWLRIGRWSRERSEGREAGREAFIKGVRRIITEEDIAWQIEGKGGDESVLSGSTACIGNSGSQDDKSELEGEVSAVKS